MKPEYLLLFLYPFLLIHCYGLLIFMLSYYEYYSDHDVMVIGYILAVLSGSNHVILDVD